MNIGRGPGNRASSFLSSLEVIKHEPQKEKIMRVKLKADYEVCKDGINLSRHAAGEEVDMPIHIAQDLLKDGRATIPKTKNIPGAPSNKMNPGPDQNKGKG